MKRQTIDFSIAKAYMMTHARFVLLPTFLAICVSACGDKEPPVASSVVAEGIYTNEYFGLKLAIPDGWFVASKDSEQLAREVGEDLVVGDDATLKAALEASKKTTFQLLTLSQFEMGAAVDFNPNLILMAERVSHVPGIKSGKDYLFHTGKMLSRSQLSYEVATETYPTQLGGREWHRADFVINQPQMSIEQSHFAMKYKDFVLLIVLSASTKEQMSALEQIATSITL